MKSMVKNCIFFVIFFYSTGSLSSQITNHNKTNCIEFTDYLNILKNKKVDTIVYIRTDTSHKEIFFYFLNGILYLTAFDYLDYNDSLIIGKINDREITDEYIKKKLLKFVKKITRKNPHVICIHCPIKGKHFGDWRRLDIAVPYKNNYYVLINWPMTMQVDFIKKFLMKKERKAGEKFIHVIQKYLNESINN
jgi:hypothetical protein